FALSILMPGDALTGTIDPTISAAQLEAMREKLGLNKPWYERYIDWMKGVLVGDFGRSWKYKQPVLSIIGQRVWPTIWLSLFTVSILMPGDALTGTIDPTISAAQLEAMREKLGLNKPWYERYIDWMKGVLVGDFGRSWKYKQPVLSIIGQRVWPTIWLSLFT